MLANNAVRSVNARPIPEGIEDTINVEVLAHRPGKLSKENGYLPPVGKVYTMCRRLVRMDEQASERYL